MEFFVLVIAVLAIQVIDQKHIHVILKILTNAWEVMLDLNANRF